MTESSSGSKQGQRLFTNNGPSRNHSNCPVWDSNDRYKYREILQRDGELRPSCETNRGPRAQGGPTLAKNDLLGHNVRNDKYNLLNFETKYENAKFFVLKSFHEADIHKSIKYNVWSSTRNGNRKLEAAYHESDRISSETGKICPIFLFFSANGSGQFVGLAEMTGPVDFNKNMDFWQTERWSGFFPIEWHIIKDIPNYELRHIILENNENKPVTHSRDTQEIGFKQGLEMLEIFKNYPVKTMLLDDYDFYENEGKTMIARSCEVEKSPQTRTYHWGGVLSPTPLMVPVLAPSPPTKKTANSPSRSVSHSTTNYDDKPLPVSRVIDFSPTKTPSSSRSKSASRNTSNHNDGGLSDVPSAATKMTSNSPSKSASLNTANHEDKRLPGASSEERYESDAGKKRGIFKENDLVMAYQKIRTVPSNKLHMKRIGPFRIQKQINDKEYKVHLPSDIRIRNTFDVANLSHYICDIVPPVKLPSWPPITKDRISVVLCKDTVITTKRTYTKFLVKWNLIPKDTWLNEETFQQIDPEFYNRYMAYVDEEQAREQQARELEENDNARTKTKSFDESKGSPDRPKDVKQFANSD